MPKKQVKVKKKTDEMTAQDILSNAKLDKQDRMFVQNLVSNATLMRENLLNKLIDERRDIDNECGYPKNISTEQYKILYDRESIATRVVSIFPEESWVEDPDITENEEMEFTEFEEKWKELDRNKHIFSYMNRVDELSGIGRYGILLLGIDDGKELDQPVEGINEKGERVGNPEYELLYLKALDESMVNIKEKEKDRSNPRFGRPTMYSVSFESTNKTRSSSAGEISVKTGQEQLVHWTRVVHIADNRKSSEIYGVPRMQTLFNRLYDLRKICGGSAEMFWKGGFPGYLFKMDPQAQGLTSSEKSDLRTTVADFANGLQRYMRLQGVEVESLEPQVADPKEHVEIQLELIAITMGVPKRIFMGSEQAKLASSKDSENWNKRIRRRQKKYVTPYIINPVIDRFIAFGILPEPEKYDVIWPDLDTPSEKDRAEVMKLKTEAYAKYVAGNVDMLIPPEMFLKIISEMNEDQIQEIVDTARERQKDLEVAVEEDTEFEEEESEE